MLENERSWILFGKLWRGVWFLKKTHQSEGHPFEVSFNNELVIQAEDNGTPIIGWLHTHPGMLAVPSSRDVATMHGWTLSLGRPLLCAIHGSDGLRGWWFIDDEHHPVERKLVQIPFGIILGTKL